MAGYQQWYKTTPAGERELRALLENDPSAREEVTRRLNEMKSVPEGRCAITRQQIAFLERVLA